jgi:hypothetical protein
LEHAKTEGQYRAVLPPDAREVAAIGFADRLSHFLAGVTAKRLRRQTKSLAHPATKCALVLLCLLSTDYMDKLI